MAVMDVARSDQEFFGRKRKVVFQGGENSSRPSKSPEVEGKLAIELTRTRGAKIGDNHFFQQERAIIVTPDPSFSVPPTPPPSASSSSSSVFTPQPVPHPSVFSPFLPAVTQTKLSIPNASLPNLQRLIVNSNDVPSLQRSLISYPTPNAEPAISRSDTLLHRPAVWRGVEEHVGERRSGWRFDRHAEEKAVTMAYGMLQRAKGSSYPEILRGLCDNGEIAMINRFISLLLEFLNDHKRQK